MRFAENMIAVAVGWQVFAIHKDPLDLGLIGLAEFVPLLVLALPAGHLADRLPRRMIAALALALMVGVSIALLIVTVTDPGVVWPYFLLAALTGVAAAVGWPAYQALTPEVVPPDVLPGRGRPPLGRRPDRRDRRAGRRRSGLRVEGGSRLRRRRRALPDRRHLDGLAADPVAPCRRVGRARRARRRPPVRLAHENAARRDLARSLRGAPGRRCGAAADLRAGDPPRRAGRARRPPRRAGRGRARRRADPGAAAAAPCSRADVDRGGRPLRRREHRLGPVEVAAAHPRRARGRRLRRHDQRQHPLDHRRADHPERAARTRRRGRDGLHLRVERARRVRIGRRRRPVRRGRDGRRGRDRDDRDRARLGEGLPRARADGETRGAAACTRR